MVIQSHIVRTIISSLIIIACHNCCYRNMVYIVKDFNNLYCFNIHFLNNFIYVKHKKYVQETLNCDSFNTMYYAILHFQNLENSISIKQIMQYYIFIE